MGKPKRPVGKPRKPASVDKEVISRRIAGQSRRQIAREVGIDRGTVAAILTRTQAEECIIAARNRLIGMADKAVNRIDRAIGSRKRDGLDASALVLRGIGVIHEHAKSEVK